jgi:hypothetical protein
MEVWHRIPSNTIGQGISNKNAAMRGALGQHALPIPKNRRERRRVLTAGWGHPAYNAATWLFKML